MTSPKRQPSAGDWRMCQRTRKRKHAARASVFLQMGSSALQLTASATDELVRLARALGALAHDGPRAGARALAGLAVGQVGRRARLQQRACDAKRAWRLLGLDGGCAAHVGFLVEGGGEFGGLIRGFWGLGGAFGGNSLIVLFRPRNAVRCAIA